jgi:hypothetical protein
MTAQVHKVWELIVCRHPHFVEWVERGNWGFARKSTAASRSRLQSH